ncbi:MAG: hypothetical protein ACPL7R_10505, partial [Anaerolineae bacterium]
MAVKHSSKGAVAQGPANDYLQSLLRDEALAHAWQSYLQPVSAIRAATQGQAEDAASLAALGPLTLVLGEPLNGKSTLLAYLAYETANRGLLAAPDERPGYPIPILVDAEACPADASLDDIVAQALEKHNISADEAATRQWLDNATFLFLVDQVDRVGGAPGPKWVREICSAVQPGGRVKAIFASRPTAWPGRAWGLPDVPALRLG